jgi:hypothetical protein
MKRSIIVFSAILSVITATAFVGARPGGNPAEATFQKEFSGATNIKWNEGKEIISATFVLSDSRIIAYFTTEGALIGTERNVLFNQLPLAVIKEINNRYGNAPIFDIVEYTSGTETFYGMGVDTPTKHLKLKISAEGDVTVQQKEKK